MTPHLQAVNQEMPALRYVLKTCGTTRLLNSVPKLLELAAQIGMEPSRCKFSRATFLFPEHQVKHVYEVEP